MSLLTKVKEKFNAKAAAFGLGIGAVAGVVAGVATKFGVEGSLAAEKTTDLMSQYKSELTDLGFNPQGKTVEGCQNWIQNVYYDYGLPGPSGPTEAQQYLSVYMDKFGEIPAKATDYASSMSITEGLIVGVIVAAVFGIAAYFISKKLLSRKNAERAQ